MHSIFKRMSPFNYLLRELSNGTRVVLFQTLFKTKKFICFVKLDWGKRTRLFCKGVRMGIRTASSAGVQMKALFQDLFFRPQISQILGVLHHHLATAGPAPCLFLAPLPSDDFRPYLVNPHLIYSRCPVRLPPFSSCNAHTSTLNLQYCSFKSKSWFSLRHCRKTQIRL